MNEPYWLLLLCVLPASWVLTELVRRFALARAWIDQPGPRASHAQPTPRGGGLAIAVVTLIIAQLLSFEPFLLLGLALIAMVGLVDDARGLPAAVKFGGQIVALVFVIAGMGWSVREDTWLLFLLSAPAALWLVNLVNFMDGANGFAATQVIFSALVLAGLGGLPQQEMALALAVAMATLGFLPFNFPVARLFLGDTGSQFLGLVLATFLLYGAHEKPLVVFVVLGSLAWFIVDATFTLLRRIWKRESWYTAHREHAYQRLLRMGVSHVNLTITLIVFNVIFILPLLWLGVERERWALSGLVIAWSVCAIVWGLIERKWRVH